MRAHNINVMSQGCSLHAARMGFLQEMTILLSSKIHLMVYILKQHHKSLIVHLGLRLSAYLAYNCLPGLTFFTFHFHILSTNSNKSQYQLWQQHISLCFCTLCHLHMLSWSDLPSFRHIQLRKNFLSKLFKDCYGLPSRVVVTNKYGDIRQSLNIIPGTKQVLNKYYHHQQQYIQHQ